MTTYTGRFAPSPSGPLHFGSLVSALASYLDARQHQGHWRIRIDDIDPPREVPGAADLILQQLEDHGLHWDGAVVFQSHHKGHYENALQDLNARGLLFACDCSRQRLAALGGVYDGLCRDRSLPLDAPAVALRLRVPDKAPPECFEDLFQGLQSFDLNRDSGDFVLRRKDGLYAYQLATACDEIDLGITHIIRGADLLDSTARQRYLIGLLGGTQPIYGHVPAAVTAAGHKLSKQNHAPAIEGWNASQNLQQALTWLGLAPTPDLVGAAVGELLTWAISQWDRGQIPRRASRPAPS